MNFLASVAKITEISPSVNTLSKDVHKIYTLTHKSKVAYTSVNNSYNDYTSSLKGPICLIALNPLNVLISSSNFSYISSKQFPLKTGTYLLPHNLNSNSFPFQSNFISFLVFSILSYFFALSIISSISSSKSIKFA